MRVVNVDDTQRLSENGLPRGNIHISMRIASAQKISAG
jgi:hypothetical protein